MTHGTVTLHRNRPPFAPVMEMRSAANIDRVMPVNEPGSLTFTLWSNEINRYAPVGTSTTPPNIREGGAIVVRSTESVAPWLWIINSLEEDAEAETVTVNCMEWRDLLYRRQVPLAFTARSRSAVGAATALLAAVNGRNATHIEARGLGLGSSRLILPDEELPLGGNTVGAAFDELALRTDTEWWVEYDVSWAGVVPLLFWGQRRGRDRTRDTALDIHHISSAIYRRDEGDVVQASQVIGATQRIADAPAGAVVVGQAVAVTRPALGGRVQRATTFTERLTRTRSGGPGATSEEAQALPSEESETALVQSSERQQHTPISSRQSVEVEVRYPWPGSADWNTMGGLAASTLEAPSPALTPGDTILVRLPRANFGVGVEIVARILAMQPDEATGILGLVIEAQPGTLQWLRGIEE